MKIKHGGDWAGFKEKYGREPLDFSANISPLGLPAGVSDAVAASLPGLGRYPDQECREVRQKISDSTGIAPEYIMCGNGASDLIERFACALRPRKALVTAPTFGEYRQSLERYGCEVSVYRLTEEKRFRITEDILDMITDDTDVVVLCEPNNPTGITTGKPLLNRIVSRCRECGALMMVDECFNDFLDTPEVHSMIRMIDNYPLLILRAFTKFYAMAGIRFGYCVCADTVLLSKMRDAGQPWPVSSPAQAAAAAALDESDYRMRLRELISGQRPWMMAALRSLGCRVIGSEANYIFFHSNNEMLKEKMAENGVLIRSCADYDGLSTGWYRVAVRTEAENLELIRIMGQVI